MALNLDKIGQEYDSYRYEVSREKIREYATALGLSDPRFHSEGDDCVAPPTFVACFTIVRGGAQMFADPDLGAHWTLVHGAQRFDLGDRLLRPGDVVVCTPRIAAISHRGANEFLTLEIDCRFEDTDELAVTATNTIVFLGSAPQATDADAEQEAS